MADRKLNAEAGSSFEGEPMDADAASIAEPSAPEPSAEIVEAEEVVDASPPASSTPGDAASQSQPSSSGPSRPAGRRFRYREVLAQKYRLEKSIARGGMGRVFLATQLPLERQVAIKVLIPQPGDTAFQQRFLLEASTCAKLSHPNIVTIHDYGQTEVGDLYMAMEYLDGPSLSRLLSRDGRLPSERVTRIAIQVARALRAAHRQGVVHRDLKPSNIMLLKDEDPEDEGSGDLVKVVDFGIAKIFERQERPGAVQLTRAGMMLGSPRYMAPEQIRNRAVDPRTDIYALGVITFSMLAGRPPFDGDNATDILTQHLRDEPPSPSAFVDALDIPGDLERIVMRCLAKRPEDRYQGTDELLAELRAVHRHITDRSVSSGLRATPSMNTLEAVEEPDPSRALAAPSDSAPRRRQSGWWALVIVLTVIVGSLAFWAIVLTEAT